MKLISVIGGIVMTLVHFITVVLTDNGDSMTPLLERHPFAWTFFWIEIFPHTEMSSLYLAFIFNTVIYSVALYFLLRWAINEKKL